jgi:DnaK suppressor protein
MPAADETSSEPELDLDELAERLRADLSSIGAEIEELTKPPEAGGSIGFGKRIGEGTNEAISRFTDVGVANDLQKLRERTERALEKLDEGTYGTCDNCGKPIPAGRLHAAPASPLCIECARATP